MIAKNHSLSTNEYVFFTAVFCNLNLTYNRATDEQSRKKYADQYAEALERCQAKKLIGCIASSLGQDQPATKETIQILKSIVSGALLTETAVRRQRLISAY